MGLTEDERQSLEEVLFRGEAIQRDTHASALLEQYKLLVTSSQALETRRQVVNTFFLTINTFLLGGAGYLLTRGDVGRLEGTGLELLAAAGFILCVAWRRMIVAFGQLNGGKFEVIHLLEKRLPASVFRAEWKALGEGANRKKYTPFTRTEQQVPWSFGLIHVVLIVLGAYVLATGSVF